MDITNWSYEKFVSKKWIHYLFLAILATCFVCKFFLCSVSVTGDKVLFPMTADYWDFGKELLGGKILYKDVIDHKGLYLYVIYAIAVFFSGNNIAIVAFLEGFVYIATVFIFYWYIKNTDSFVKNKDSKTSFLFPTTVFAVTYLLLTSNVTMVNTEGLSAIALVWIYGSIKKDKIVTLKKFAVVGAILGVLFNIKITSVAIFFPIFVYACAKHLKNKGERKELLCSVFAGIAGFLCINIPFLFYLTKNSCLNGLIQVYQYTCERSDNFLIMTIAICFILLGISVVCLFKEKDNICQVFLCLSILWLCFAFGSDACYYIPIYCVVCFLEMFRFRKINIPVTMGILLVFLAYGIGRVDVTLTFQKYLNTKEMTEKYGMTNRNVVYFGEDWGFGVYSDELFVEPYQWVPFGIFSSETFSEYYKDLSIERIQNKRFDYVFADFSNIEKHTNDENLPIYLENMYEVMLELKPYLEENYEYVEENVPFYKAKQ